MTRAALLPFELHGFVQVYYRAGDKAPDTYRLRKADVKFSGALSPRLRWRVNFDAAKSIGLTKTSRGVGDTAVLADAAIDQKGRMLQDAAITYALNNSMRLDIGQQIIPLSLEGAFPSAKVETIERTMFIANRSRGAGLGDVREVGVTLNGTTLGSLVEYHIGSFNAVGEDQNSIATSDQKSIVGRVAIFPSWIPGFQFGGSGAYQGGLVSQRRERAGGELQYRTQMLTLRSEVMRARDGNARRLVWYSLAAVRPSPDWQFVARVDDWDPDINKEPSIAKGYTRQVVVGGSYLIDNDAARIVVNLVRATYPTSGVASNQILMVAFQGAW